MSRLISFSSELGFIDRSVFFFVDLCLLFRSVFTYDQDYQQRVLLAQLHDKKRRLQKLVWQDWCIPWAILIQHDPTWSNKALVSAPPIHTSFGPASEATARRAGTSASKTGKRGNLMASDHGEYADWICICLNVWRVWNFERPSKVGPDCNSAVCRWKISKHFFASSLFIKAWNFVYIVYIVYTSRTTWVWQEAERQKELEQQRSISAVLESYAQETNFVCDVLDMKRMKYNDV